LNTKAPPARSRREALATLATVIVAASNGSEAASITAPTTPHQASPVRALWEEYESLLLEELRFKAKESVAHAELQRRKPPVPEPLTPPWLADVELSMFPWMRGSQVPDTQSYFDTYIAGKLLGAFETPLGKWRSIVVAGHRLDRLHIEQLAKLAEDYQRAVKEVIEETQHLFPPEDDDPFDKCRHLEKVIIETPARSLQDIGLKLIAAKFLCESFPAYQGIASRLGSEALSLLLATSPGLVEASAISTPIPGVERQPLSTDDIDMLTRIAAAIA
jgi:hypothetical protein